MCKFKIFFTGGSIKKSLLKLILISFVFNYSCGRNDEDDDRSPIDPNSLKAPSSLSLSYDFSLMGGDNFEFSSRIFQLTDFPILLSYNSDARATVGGWNLTLQKSIVIPIIALQKLATETPTLDETTAKRWEFEIKANGQTWQVKFFGDYIRSDRTIWRMELSKAEVDDNNCCTNYTVMTGNTSSHNNGSWRIYGIGDDNYGNALLDINYEIISDDFRTLNYVNIETADSATALIKDDIYSLATFGAETSDKRLIKWTKDLTGSIDYGNKEFTGCWDESFQDKDCESQ